MRVSKTLLAIVLTILLVPSIAFAGVLASGTAGEQNTFVSTTYAYQGLVNISISGTFAATVTVQRSFDNGSTWLDVNTYTEISELVIDGRAEPAMYKVGVKTGAYTSGTVTIRIGGE